MNIELEQLKKIDHYPENNHKRALITYKHTEMLECIPYIMVLLLRTWQAEP